MKTRANYPYENKSIVTDSDEPAFEDGFIVNLFSEKNKRILLFLTDFQ